MIRIFLLALTLLFLATSIVRADFSDGVFAYLKGDFDSAHATLRPLAETADHGLAQYWMGVMYLQGQGVEQSYEEAAKWLRKASEKSVPQAQHKLANLYMKGLGVPRDYEYAYAWYRTAAASEHKLSINMVDKAKEYLSAEELKEANKLSAEFISKFGLETEQKAAATQTGNR